MKRILITLLTILVLSFAVFGQQKTAAEYLADGIRYSNEGNSEKSFEALKASVKLDPKNELAQFNLGIASMILEKYSEAVDAFRKAVELSPDNSRFHGELCRALWEDSQSLEAIDECKKATSLDDKNADAHNYTIKIQSISGLSVSQMLRRIDDLLNRFPDHVGILATAAYIYEKHDINRSIGLYQRLFELRPIDIRWPLALFDIFQRLDRDADAIEMLRQVVEIRPDHITARYRLAGIYNEIGAIPEAIDMLRGTLEVAPEFTDATFLLAICLKKAGRSDEAISKFRAAVAQEPDSFDYRLEFASMLNQAAKYEEAAVEFRKLELIEPKDLYIKVQLGLALFESAQFAEGISVLNEADLISPANPVVNMFLRVARARQQGVNDIDKMKKIAAANPESPEIRISLIEILNFARRQGEAKEYIDQFWEINPDDPKMYHSLATVFATLADYDNAIRAYERSLKNGDNPGSYFGLGMMYSRKGMLPETIAAYEKGFELQPDAGGFRQFYGIFLEEQGQYESALSEYKKSLALRPDNPPLISRAAFISVRLGFIDEAMSYLETLRYSNPENAKSLERYIKWKKSRLLSIER